MTKSITQKKTPSALQKLKDNYSSLEAMAEALRSHPEFATLNRSTIARWLSTNEKLPSRAHFAIQILHGRKLNSKIRVAHPTENIWALPAMMLDWGKTGTPPGLLTVQEAYGVQIENQPVLTGKEALELLADKKVDVALASPDLFLESHRKVCTVSVGSISGISVGVVDDITAIRGKLVGFPKGTALGTLISQRYQKMGVRTIAVSGRDEGVKSLRAKEVDILLWWEPIAGSILEEINTDGGFRRIPSNLFGQIEVDLAIPKHRAQPHLIRAYIRCLQASVAFLSTPSAIGDLNEHLKTLLAPLSPSEITELLKTCDFNPQRWDIKTLLDLWEAEVEFKKQ